MTETKKKLPEPIPVDSEKLIGQLGTIFGGVIQLLAAMEPGMAKELADMAINGVPKEKAPENFNPDDFEEILAADDLPWETAEQPKEEAKSKETESRSLHPLSPQMTSPKSSFRKSSRIAATVRKSALFSKHMGR